MKANSEYEKILAELKNIPPARLTKVLKLIRLVREEFIDIEEGANEKGLQRGREVLLSLAEGLGEGPEDLAEEHDKYLY